MVRLVGFRKISRRRFTHQHHLAGRRSRTQHSYSGTPAARDKP
ncbi:hypothetical protein [Shigella dysenteriae]